MKNSKIIKTENFLFGQKYNFEDSNKAVFCLNDSDLKIILSSETIYNNFCKDQYFYLIKNVLPSDKDVSDYIPLTLLYGFKNELFFISNKEVNFFLGKKHTESFSVAKINKETKVVATNSFTDEVPYVSNPLFKISSSASENFNSFFFFYNCLLQTEIDLKLEEVLNPLMFTPFEIHKNIIFEKEDNSIFIKNSILKETFNEDGFYLRKPKFIIESSEGKFYKWNTDSWLEVFPSADEFSYDDFISKSSFFKDIEIASWSFFGNKKIKIITNDYIPPIYLSNKKLKSLLGVEKFAYIRSISGKKWIMNVGEI